MKKTPTACALRPRWRQALTPTNAATKGTPMLIFDLQKPMITAARVHDTEEHPLTALATLADRSIGMMMVYNLDETTISYTFLSFDPDTRKHITVEAPNPARAYELAQAEYQRDTGPSRSVQ